MWKRLESEKTLICLETLEVVFKHFQGKMFRFPDVIRTV